MTLHGISHVSSKDEGPTHLHTNKLTKACSIASRGTTTSAVWAAGALTIDVRARQRLNL